MVRWASKYRANLYISLRSKLSGQAQICNLHTVILDQHILGLDISIEKAVQVHIRQYLVHEAATANFGLQVMPVALLHGLVQIALHVLKHNVQLVVLSDHFLILVIILG